MQMTVESVHQAQAAATSFQDSHNIALQPFSPASPDGFSSPMSQLNTSFADKSK